MWRWERLGWGDDSFSLFYGVSLMVCANARKMLHWNQNECESFFAPQFYVCVCMCVRAS